MRRMSKNFISDIKQLNLTNSNLFELNSTNISWKYLKIFLKVTLL